MGRAHVGPLTAAKRAMGFGHADFRRFVLHGLPCGGSGDWEWGVDLFADDHVVFKKLVYEMRFDEASALYGLFGSFYMGLEFPAEELGALLEGRSPGVGVESPT